MSIRKTTEETISVTEGKVQAWTTRRDGKAERFNLSIVSVEGSRQFFSPPSSVYSIYNAPMGQIDDVIRALQSLKDELNGS